jgi:hypothetical protein
MISKKQGQLSKNLGKTKIISRWIRGRRELSHHSSEIIHRVNKLLKRKKGAKAPFFRNNPQGQQTPREEEGS